MPAISMASERLAAPPNGIDEPSIALLVETFYRRVRRDPLLCPVFERTIGATDADWIGHLKLLRDFWSSVMLTSGRYHGNPRIAHLGLPELVPAMFDRWLALFDATCADVLDPQAAAAFTQRAERIGQNLRRGREPAAMTPGDAGR